MNKSLKESVILIVAILIVVAAIVMNFIAIIKYELLEYKYTDMENAYQVEIEQKNYKIETLEEHNLRLEEIIRDYDSLTKEE